MNTIKYVRRDIQALQKWNKSAYPHLWGIGIKSNAVFKRILTKEIAEVTVLLCPNFNSQGNILPTSLIWDIQPRYNAKIQASLEWLDYMQSNILPWKDLNIQFVLMDTHIITAQNQWEFVEAIETNKDMYAAFIWDVLWSDSIEVGLCTDVFDIDRLIINPQDIWKPLWDDFDLIIKNNPHLSAYVKYVWKETHIHKDELFAQRQLWLELQLSDHLASTFQDTIFLKEDTHPVRKFSLIGNTNPDYGPVNSFVHQNLLISIDTIIPR